MSTEPILTQFRELDSDEKIRLVQDLWDEIAEEVAHRPLSDAQRRLLDERILDEERNPDDFEAWSKAKEDILRNL
jgi:putative addiction module component (TIGR02574 family)